MNVAELNMSEVGKWEGEALLMLKVLSFTNN
jgi:hypothetical protein